MSIYIWHKIVEKPQRLVALESLFLEAHTADRDYIENACKPKTNMLQIELCGQKLLQLNFTHFTAV